MITEVEIKEHKREKMPPSPINATSHVSLVTYLVKGLKDSLEYNKILTDQVKRDLSEVGFTISNSQEEIQRLIKPSLQSLWNTLDNYTEQQKIENQHIQQQLVELKKQNSVLRQHLSQGDKKIKELGQKIGQY